MRRLVDIFTANMSAVAEKEIILQLHPDLSEKSEVFSTYLNNDSLKHEIEKLKLEDGTKFASLVEALEVKWKSAATFLVQEASTRRQHTDKSAIAHDVSVVLLRVVEKHQSDHPQEVKNESIRKQHHYVVAVIVIEAAYEISTGRAGTFAPALFGSKWLELALKILQRKRSRNEDSASRRPSTACRMQLGCYSSLTSRSRQDSPAPSPPSNAKSPFQVFEDRTAYMTTRILQLRVVEIGRSVEWKVSLTDEARFGQVCKGR